MDCSPECIRHCSGICCNGSGIYLDLSEQEVNYLQLSGTILTPISDEGWTGRRKYRRENTCGYQDGNSGLCREHPANNLTGDKRPQICREFIPGLKPCLVFRAEYSEGVRELTIKDEQFQNWYFGFDDE